MDCAMAVRGPLNAARAGGGYTAGIRPPPHGFYLLQPLGIVWSVNGAAELFCTCERPVRSVATRSHLANCLPARLKSLAGDAMPRAAGCLAGGEGAICTWRGVKKGAMISYFSTYSIPIKPFPCHNPLVTPSVCLSSRRGSNQAHRPASPL